MLEMKITIYKWLPYSIILLLAVIAFTSCSDKEGGWDDNIGFLHKTALFQSSADSTIISTQEGGWWLSDASLDGTFITAIDSIDTTSDNFEINTSSVTITRLNSRQLKIKMSQNLTTEERILKIGLQSGNFFDRITITQEKT